MMKKCNRCKTMIELNLYNFYRDVYEGDGWNQWCIKCVKKYYQDNKEKYIPKSRKLVPL